MGKRPRKKLALDPVAVLESRVPIEAGDLLDLIHEVNPTGLELPQKEAQRRYALKTRLQSLLCRRFGALLQVYPDAREAGLVCLELAQSGRNGCHARLAALDEDARSFVQHQLDVAAYDRPPPLLETPAAPGKDAPARTPRSKVEELLAAGLAAQEGYDLETAQQLFAEALRRSGYAPLPALRLLTLLVDHLAADSEALALRSVLSAAARADAEVRLLLAQAAVRADREDLATELLRDLDRPQAAPVLRLLCRRALARDALAEAETHWQAARALDPAHAEVVLLQETIDQARARQRRPLEEQLVALQEAGRCEEALAAARALLARWPESRVGGRVLRALLERQQEDAARRLFSRAMDAQGSGDLGRAVAFLQEALAVAAAGPLREQIAAHLAEAEAQHREQAATQAVEAMRRRLAEAPPAVPALLAYAQLDPPLRARVRAHCPLPPLGWIDEILLARPGSPLRPVAEAAHALQGAHQQGPERPSEALALIHAHERFLMHVSDTPRLSARLRELLRLRRRQCAQGQLQAALAADQAYQLPVERCLELLDAVYLPALSEEERQMADALRQRLERHRHRQRTFARISTHMEHMEPLAALALFQTLPPPGPDEGETEAAMSESLRTMAQAIHHTLLDRHPGVPQELCDLDLRTAARQGVQHWIGPSEDEVVLACQQLHTLFVRVYDLRTGYVSARMSFNAPGPLGCFQLRRHVVIGSSLFLLDSHGAFVEVALPSFLIQRIGTGPLDSITEGDPGKVEQPLLAADGRTLWLPTPGAEDGAASLVRVVDTRGTSQQRELTERLFVRPLPGTGEGGETLMCCPKQGGRIALFSDRGVFLRDLPAGADLHLREVSPHPAGRGLLLCGQDGGASGPLRLFTSEAGRTQPVDLPLPEPRDRAAVTGVTDQAARLTFLLLPEASQTWLRALRPGDSPAGLEAAYQVPLPPETVLLQSLSGGAVIALSQDVQGVRALRLSAVQPPPPRCAAVGALVDREAICGYGCAGTLQFAEPGDKAVLQEAATHIHAKDYDDPGLRAFIHGCRPDLRRHAQALLAAAQLTGQLPTYADAIAEITPRCADDPWLSLWIAHYHLWCKHWQRSREILERAGTRGLSGAEVRHHHHLHGVALLFLREHDAALTALRRAEASGPGPCQLAALIHLAEPLPRRLRAADWDEGQPLMRQLCGAIHTADLCMDQNDPRGAVAALDRYAVHRSGELQGLARLVHAWERLTLDSISDADLIRKELCTNSLLEAMKRFDAMPFLLPFRSPPWVLERIRDLLHEAQQSDLQRKGERAKQMLALCMARLKRLCDDKAAKLNATMQGVVARLPESSVREPMEPC